MTIVPIMQQSYYYKRNQKPTEFVPRSYSEYFITFHSEAGGAHNLRKLYLVTCEA